MAADFPASGGLLVNHEDSALFGESRIDPTMRKEMEGGYTYTRPRFTRTKKTFTTGFTWITQAQKQELDDFWDSKIGGQSFVYQHPITGVEYTVRFNGRYRERYEGMGSAQRWTITDIVLEEV